MYANNIGEAEQPSRNPTGNGSYFSHIFNAIIIHIKKAFFVKPEYHPQAQEVAQIHPLCHKPFLKMPQINNILPL